MELKRDTLVRIIFYDHVRGVKVVDFELKYCIWVPEYLLHTCQDFSDFVITLILDLDALEGILSICLLEFSLYFLGNKYPEQDLKCYTYSNPVLLLEHS